jgi:hypothetical protein
MPNIAGWPVAIGQYALESSSTQRHPLGQPGVTADGRFYRYALAGAADLVVGNALQSRVEDTDHDNVTVRATAKGARSLLITTGSGGGALDADEYKDGFAVIDTTPGLGYLYKISGHAAVSASTNGELFLADNEEVQVALTTDSKITLVANPYSKVIQSPVTTATGVPVGGAIYIIVAAQYGWIQSGGLGAALIYQTPAAGQPVTITSAVAGSLAVHSAELSNVAHMAVTGRDGKVLPVQWLLY